MGLFTSFIGTKELLTGNQKTAIRVLDCTEANFELKSTKSFILSTVTVLKFFVLER